MLIQRAHGSKKKFENFFTTNCLEKLHDFYAGSQTLKKFLKKTEKAKLLQVEAQEEMANEDLKTFEKSGNLPKLTPVLFNKRKESDILETHRGNYKRHWETSSRLEPISARITY